MPACAKCPSSARFRFGENATDTNVFYRKLHLLKKQSTGVFKSLLKTFLPYLSSLFPYEQVLQCLKIKQECLTLNQCKMLCNSLLQYEIFECSDLLQLLLLCRMQCRFPVRQVHCIQDSKKNQADFLPDFMNPILLFQKNTYLPAFYHNMLSALLQALI